MLLPFEEEKKIPKPQSKNFNERLEAKGREMFPSDRKEFGSSSIRTCVFKGMCAVGKLRKGGTMTIEASTEM